MKGAESQYTLSIPLNLQNRKIRNFFVFLVCVGGLLLRLRTPAQAREVLIVPDGVEYSVSAMNLMEGKGYTLAIEGRAYPPRAPFGYSLCLIPFYFFLGKSLGNGIFCTLFFSVASGFLIFSLARHLFNEKVAFWSILFLALSPIHLYWSRQIMADIPTSFFALLCFWFYFGGDIMPSRAFLLGVFLGFGCWVKYVNLLFIFPILISLFRKNIPFRKMFFSGASFLTGFILSLSPLLWYNHSVFGDFFKTGFSFWIPHWMQFKNFLSSRYAFHKPRFPQGGPPGFLAFWEFLLGCVVPWHQNPYPFFLAPFLGVGTLRILRNNSSKTDRKREFLFFTTLTAGFFYVFFGFYFAQNMRYFLPIMPLLLILVGVGFDYFFDQCPRVLETCFFIFIGTFLIVSPFLLWKVDQRPFLKKTYRQLIEYKTEENARIITAWDPVSFFHEIQKGSEKSYIPISEGVEYIRKLSLPDPKRKFFIGISLSEAPAYLDSLSCKSYPAECALLKKKFRLQEVASSDEIRLYRLEGI